MHIYNAFKVDFLTINYARDQLGKFQIRPQGYNYMQIQYQMMKGSYKVMLQNFEARNDAKTCDISLKYQFQIVLESKVDDLGHCYIDFELTHNGGDLAAKQQSEKKTCRTHGVKNRIDFGTDWDEWEG